MCPPKVKTPAAPAPPPSAPPPASETATGFSSPSQLGSDSLAVRNTRGLESLRVALNVPQTGGGLGINVP